MHLTILLLVNILLSAVTLGHTWPYNRYHAQRTKNGRFHANISHPEFEEYPQNTFVHWLHQVSNTQDSAAVRSMFINDTIPKHVTGFDELYEYLDVPVDQLDVGGNGPHLRPLTIPHLPSGEAVQLLSHLNYSLDLRCTVDRSRWWYRTYDGSCNWLKSDEISEGQIGTAKVRDYNQHTYADGISEPREGPNPRAVSNAFFRRNATIYYEHTPLLLGLIEFIMHDITYSLDSSSEYVDVSMPADEDYFDSNTTFRVWRTEAVPGTGTSVQNPRENVNMATTWLDISSLYGSTSEVARALRSFKSGKLLTQELKTRGRSTYASYLPFNSMNVPMRTRPDVDPKSLFAGGDPRTNEDWLMLGVHTLMLREHNRLCDILAKQHPEYDDEQLYQTIRLVMSAKYALIANSYQMAYWTNEMPWPRDDGFPLYREMYGETVLEINPMNTYPWPLVTKAGKPMVVSAEMAIVYRFHEFIIPEFPIIDATNQTLWNQSVFETGFNPQGFIDAGLENVLRGTVGTHIPNFKSGVDENFRSAGKYRDKPFDVVTWSLVHEREQGLPTFNQYFRAYNEQDPAVFVDIRDTFEKFSSDADTVAKLKRLYSTPDDVDLVVGVQLDEELFPGTTVPKSALIISLFSLFGMGNSDRFSVGFAVTKCLLVDTPYDCKPTNALEELLWISKPLPSFPNARWFDSFWLTELDFQAHGTNLLWRLVTENSDIHCIQRNPLFPADPIANPVLCVQQRTGFWTTVQTIALTVVEGSLALSRQHPMIHSVILFGLGAFGAWYWYTHRSKTNTPPVFSGWPILGKALTFQKDPKELLLTGLKQYGETPSRVFGLKLASLTHFVISQPADLEVMLADNPYEFKFSLHAFFSAINTPLITHKNNFESDLHTKLIRSHLGDPETIEQFGKTIMQVSEQFLSKEILLHPGEPEYHYPGLISYLLKYITAVVGACIVGPEVLDHQDLLEIFARFNDHAIQAMGFSSLLPSFLQFIAGFRINKDFNGARKILLPIIQQRRKRTQEPLVKLSSATFLDFILHAVDQDDRAADLAVIVVWVALTNLQAMLTSLVMDIISAPSETRNMLVKDIASLDTASLSTFPGSSHPDPTNPWTALRAAMFESIRLSGPITGPARICLEDLPLPSSSSSLTDRQILPKSQVATLSSYYIHRSPSVYGADAAKWDPVRFLNSDPEIGSVKFVTWGLKGPHMCPGRWFAQECLLVMTKCLLGKYEIVPDRVMGDEEKYVYSAGSVTRKDVGVTIRARK